MKFISVQDLREKSAEVWKYLARVKDMVITSNGKPIAILSTTSEDNLEESLSAIRTARALMAVKALQMKSIQTGNDQLSFDEVEAEIKVARKSV